jgi:hypothetical protein
LAIVLSILFDWLASDYHFGIPSNFSLVLVLTCKSICLLYNKHTLWYLQTLLSTCETFWTMGYNFNKNTIKL